MIIITQPNATEEQIERVVARVREFGLDAQISRGASRVIIGVIGAEDRIREKPLAAMPGVEAIVPLEKPYKLASFEYRGAASPVAVGNVKIGGDENVALICGPCAVESQEQISSIARTVRKLGANLLRGGAVKPRTLPYSFQGLAEDGLRFLAEARRETGLPIIRFGSDVIIVSMIPFIPSVALFLEQEPRGLPSTFSAGHTRMCPWRIANSAVFLSLSQRRSYSL